MNFYLLNIVAVVLLCVLLAGIMIPNILLISFRKKLFDEPDERKIHKLAVPRLGGIAFVPVIFISIALLIGLGMLSRHSQLFYSLAENGLTASFAFCALFILYIVGMADDLIGVRYKAKFVVQVACAVLLMAGGLCIDNFHGFLWLWAVPWWVAVVFTTVLTVFIINSINLIDGIDGLASGLSAVAVCAYGVVFFLAHQYLYAILAAATFGVLVPFYYYNVFGNPEKRQKIFMGDTGSLSIGLILCILSFKMLCIPEPADWSGVNMLVVAMSPLVIPCFDVVRVYCVRLRNGRNPFLPDKNHIHHKLLAMGMRQRPAMVTIVGASVLFTIGNILLSLCINVNLVIIVDVAVWIVAILLINRRTASRKRLLAQQEKA